MQFGDADIACGRVDARVSEERLDDAQIGARLEDVRREGGR